MYSLANKAVAVVALCVSRIMMHDTIRQPERVRVQWWLSKAMEWLVAAE